MDRLKLGLLHLSVKHKAPNENRNEILNYAKEAALSGANIIVAPELSVSGYSFGSRDDIAKFTETADGETVQALRQLAEKYGVYIVLGFAERDPATNIFYNSAIALSPSGDTVCLFHKITAETRWACPGKPTQENTFETPWGKIALLICSDTYFGPIPRVAAMCGADLLIVPANWPSSGMDPKVLWRARAVENDLFVAACNRGGVDLAMSCHEAWSCAYSPNGEELLARKSADSAVFYVELPLTEAGKIHKNGRDWLSERNPALYAPMYLDMRYASDLTTYYNLPKPGELDVFTFTAPKEEVFSHAFIQCQIEAHRKQGNPSLFVFPMGRIQNAKDIRQLSLIATAFDVNICAGVEVEGKPKMIVLAEKNGELTLHRNANELGADSLCMVDIDHARVAIAFPEELIHPEFSMSASKLGCDLVICSAESLDENMQICLGAKTIEQVCVAVAATNRAFICQPPVGHSPWLESVSFDEMPCQETLQTKSTRKKRFHDRIDFERLLHLTPKKADTEADEFKIEVVVSTQNGESK
ncbi:Nitrilase/cyanide hydratase and apolipoprotein N-acyltransferase [Chloroherpeton thalassium ATCC 35110]|uniref:Nitrilase/cyanide hydratase and apolipoprotein N-acyltransferase n=1 Tax=Chloroherpeton thalassium (strain ATCC 35110 / GB-78) TaxID=517418 RepID=B3QW29_CHLT3|nr:nitrilase-related carbon-nitrogen hydrolase [Chloroherpeton thalassium]ACF14683.1 Nitrilase/cyanide hydratase and apolipoprotein N-acyltransferase [Chloroherpeton thalassium ATCC 35110]